MGKELADQWSTNLTVELTVDGQSIDGELQPPSEELPLRCNASVAGQYWIYHVAVIPGLSPGDHSVTVTFNALRPLPHEPDGAIYGPGEIAKLTFTISAR